MTPLTTGNARSGGVLGPDVTDLWGLTRRRVVDFGRATTDR